MFAANWIIRSFAGGHNLISRRGPRMNRQPSQFSLSAALRTAVAGAFCVGAVFALAGLPGFRPAQEPEQHAATPRMEMRAASAALPVYSYYPEQLAALQSLSQFQPIADAGHKPEPQPVALAVVVTSKSAGLNAAPEIRPVRRPDSPVKLAPVAALTAPVPAKAATTPAAVAPAAESPKIFGVPLAGAAEIGGRVAGLRDTAANWGQAAVGMGGQAAASLGGKIASLWR
jgi:hypothetical protein